MSKKVLTVVLCEVTQFEPNKDDQDWIKTMAKPEGASRITPVRPIVGRVRRKIREKLKHGQLAKVNDVKFYVLILCDLTQGHYLENENIFEALYGDSIVLLGGAEESDFFINEGGAVLSSSENSHISGIGIISGIEKSLSLKFFHNYYAQYHLPDTLFGDERDSSFHLSGDPSEHYKRFTQNTEQT